MIQWFIDLDVKMKLLIQSIALVSTIGSGAWFIDARYAKAEELAMQEQTLQKSLSDIKVGQFYSDRRALIREKFELENAAQSRRLTPLERQRLQQINEDISDIDRNIKKNQK